MAATTDRDDLFGYPDRPGFVRGSDTSEAAAQSIDGAPLSRMRRVVFEHIAACGERGATCDEIEAALTMRHQSASARVRELVLGGVVHDSGRRRRTRSHRQARVYEVGTK